MALFSVHLRYKKNHKEMLEMTSRERILAAIDHQPVDRVPTDIWATDEVWSMLRAQFGSEAQARESLHIDGIAGVQPAYIGPPLRDLPEDAGPDLRVFYGIWGAGLKWMGYNTGRYLEQCTMPLANAASIADLYAFPWPSPDWFDYDGFRDVARRAYERQAVMCGYMAPFYIHNLLRGMEQSLMDPLAEPDFTHELLRRICDFEYERHRRTFEAAGEFIDIAQVTDDLGSQNGPMFSLNMYREFYKPHHERFIKLCREFNIRVFHHDDGAMRTFLPDLVEMGIDVLNPVQWTCPGMEPASLKRDFGSRLCFHGGIENQRVLPFGTPDEVRAEVRHCIDTMGGDGTGYILAPCHNIQSLTPVENIVAMYDEAWIYGKR
jgi:uroporphyrinogen decarboxylase